MICRCRAQHTNNSAFEIGKTSLQSRHVAAQQANLAPLRVLRQTGLFTQQKLSYCTGTFAGHPKLMFFAMAKSSPSSVSSPYDSAASSDAPSLAQDLFRLDLLLCGLLPASRVFPRAVPLAFEEPRAPRVDFADPPRLGSAVDRKGQHLLPVLEEASVGCPGHLMYCK